MMKFRELYLTMMSIYDGILKPRNRPGRHFRFR
jgi:hypothetical protein